MLHRIKEKGQGGKTVRLVKVPAAKPDGLIQFSWTHSIEGENQLLKTAL